MNSGASGKTDQEDKPLTRADIMRILETVGSPDMLDLRGQNMMDINLANLILSGAHLEDAHLERAHLEEVHLEEAHLEGAHLEDAHLERAHLRGARLYKADLRRALLEEASLRGANLENANLENANLEGAVLTKAYLRKAHLMGARLINANLEGARLYEADLRGATLEGALLEGANLYGADLSGANLKGARLDKTDLRGTKLIGVSLEGAVLYEADLEEAFSEEATGLVAENEKAENRDLAARFHLAAHGEVVASKSALRISILEEPLTTHNLTIIISALTELFTKCWLISKHRFADLIEYTQTHNDRFDEEANVIIIQITHNSPADINFGFPNFDPEKVSNAIVTTIDGITQRKAKLEKLEIEIQARAQEIDYAKQKAEQEQQMAALEREKQELAIERERLVLLEQRLEVQKKGIEYALEIASKTVDMLHPTADGETRAMLIQSLLPSILRLQNGKGLELALPAPQNQKDEAEDK